MKKQFTTIILSTALFFVLLPFAYAITPIRTLIRPTLQQKRQETATQRCTVLTQNIDARIARFNDKKNQHITNYNRAKQKLSQLVATLQKKGYDVSKLQTDGKIWDTKIQKFATDYDTFIAKLTETKNYACAQSQGSFRSTLNQARQQIVTVRQDTADAKNFYQTVIRADMQALKSQTPAPNAPTQP